MKAKNTKKIVIFLSLFIYFSYCKGQQLPLNTDLKNIPMNAYLKDLNNELSPYLGTYKANFQGNETILYLTKTENKLVDYGDQKFYRDAIIIKYIVKNSSGTVLQDTKNTTSKIEFFSIGTRPYQNSVIFSYSGTNCNVGWGKVILKKLNDNQITWEYRPNDIILDDSKCPQGTDINIYLPETKDLIFTKQ
jgi:hypothetical protein